MTYLEGVAATHIGSGCGGCVRVSNRDAGAARCLLEAPSMVVEGIHAV